MADRVTRAGTSYRTFNAREGTYRTCAALPWPLPRPLPPAAANLVSLGLQPHDTTTRPRIEHRASQARGQPGLAAAGILHVDGAEGAYHHRPRRHSPARGLLLPPLRPLPSPVPHAFSMLSSRTCIEKASACHPFLHEQASSRPMTPRPLPQL